MAEHTAGPWFADEEWHYGSGREGFGVRAQDPHGRYGHATIEILTVVALNRTDERDGDGDGAVRPGSEYAANLRAALVLPELLDAARHLTGADPGGAEAATAVSRLREAVDRADGKIPMRSMANARHCDECERLFDLASDRDDGGIKRGPDDFPSYLCYRCLGAEEARINEREMWGPGGRP